MKYLLTTLFSALVALSYAQNETISVKSESAPTKGGEKVFTFVEEPPQFNGGDAALVKFLQKNIRYPEQARLSNVEGRAIVKFVVDEKGKVTDVTITRSSGSQALDKEAVRVTKKLPKFKPGKQQGKVVKVYFHLPVVFKLA